LSSYTIKPSFRPTLPRISNVPGYNTNTETISALCDYFEIEPGELLKKV